MIGVTLLAVPLGYVGWQAKIVRERRGVLQELRKLEATVNLVSEFEDDYKKNKRSGVYKIGDRDLCFPPFPKFSLVRRWLGDDYVASIGFPYGTSNEIADRIKAIFPEAVVMTALDPEYPSSFGVAREAVGQ